jgi:hypothetical protein
VDSTLKCKFPADQANLNNAAKIFNISNISNGTISFSAQDGPQSPLPRTGTQPSLLWTSSRLQHQTDRPSLPSLNQHAVSTNMSSRPGISSPDTEEDTDHTFIGSRRVPRPRTNIYQVEFQPLLPTPPYITFTSAVFSNYAEYIRYMSFRDRATINFNSYNRTTIHTCATTLHPCKSFLCPRAMDFLETLLFHEFINHAKNPSIFKILFWVDDIFTGSTYLNRDAITFTTAPTNGSNPEHEPHIRYSSFTFKDYKEYARYLHFRAKGPTFNCNGSHPCGNMSCKGTMDFIESDLHRQARTDTYKKQITFAKTAACFDSTVSNLPSISHFAPVERLNPIPDSPTSPAKNVKPHFRIPKIRTQEPNQEPPTPASSPCLNFKNLSVNNDDSSGSADTTINVSSSGGITIKHEPIYRTNTPESDDNLHIHEPRPTSDRSISTTTGKSDSKVVSPCNSDSKVVSRSNVQVSHVSPSSKAKGILTKARAPFHTQPLEEVECTLAEEDCARIVDNIATSNIETMVTLINNINENIPKNNGLKGFTATRLQPGIQWANSTTDTPADIPIKRTISAAIPLKQTLCISNLNPAATPFLQNKTIDFNAEYLVPHNPIRGNRAHEARKGLYLTRAKHMNHLNRVIPNPNHFTNENSTDEYIQATTNYSTQALLQHLDDYVIYNFKADYRKSDLPIHQDQAFFREHREAIHRQVKEYIALYNQSAITKYSGAFMICTIGQLRRLLERLHTSLRRPGAATFHAVAHSATLLAASNISAFNELDTSDTILNGQDWPVNTYTTYKRTADDLNKPPPSKTARKTSSILNNSAILPLVLLFLVASAMGQVDPHPAGHSGLPQASSVNFRPHPPSSFTVKDGCLTALGALVGFYICYKFTNWAMKCHYDRKARLHHEQLMSYSCNNETLNPIFPGNLNITTSTNLNHDLNNTDRDTPIQTRFNLRHLFPHPDHNYTSYARPLRLMQNGSFLCNTISSPTTPWFFIRLGASYNEGIQVKAIKDSGCDQSVISETLLKLIPRQQTLMRMDGPCKQIQTACSHIEPVLYAVEIWITFLDKTTPGNTLSQQYMFLVVNNLESDILVGQDILNGPHKVFEDRWNFYLSKDPEINRNISVYPGNDMVIVPIRTNDRYEDGQRTININYIASAPTQPDPKKRIIDPDDNSSTHTDEDRSECGHSEQFIHQQTPRPAARTTSRRLYERGPPPANSAVQQPLPPSYTSS